jgi:hypothetical protein
MRLRPIMAAPSGVRSPLRTHPCSSMRRHSSGGTDRNPRTWLARRRARNRRLRRFEQVPSRRGRGLRRRTNAGFRTRHWRACGTAPRRRQHWRRRPWAARRSQSPLLFGLPNPRFGARLCLLAEALIGPAAPPVIWVPPFSFKKLAPEKVSTYCVQG